MNPRVTDIIDEQYAAHLLGNEGEIIERHEPDPACRIHIDSISMAGAIADYLRSVAEGIPTGLSSGDVLLLADYADQLRAHHLDCLDRLDPV